MPGEPRTEAGRRLWSLGLAENLTGNGDTAALDVDRLAAASEVPCGCYNLDGGFDAEHAGHIAAAYSAVRDRVGTEEPGPEMEATR